MRTHMLTECLLVGEAPAAAWYGTIKEHVSGLCRFLVEEGLTQFINIASI